MERQGSRERIGCTPFDFDGGNLGYLVHQSGQPQTLETDFCNPFPFEIIVNGNRGNVEFFLIRIGWLTALGVGAIRLSSTSKSRSSSRREYCFYSV